MIEENQHRVAELRDAATSFCDSSFGDIPALLADLATRLYVSAAELGDAAADTSRSSMTAPMIAEGIGNVAGPWRNEQQNALFRSRELSGGDLEPLLPKVVFVNFAGNLFVSAWETVLQSWLSGAAVYGRLPAGESCLFPILMKVAADVCPAFPSLLHCDHWPAVELERTRKAIGCCDAAVVFGGDEAVGALAKLIPWGMPRRLHGGAESFAVLDEKDVSPEVVRGIAYDVGVYDQSGCLSPKLVLYVGGFDGAVSFAETLRDEMERLEQVLPRRALDLPARAAVARDRDEVLLRAALGERAKVVSCLSDPFLVTVCERRGEGERLPHSMRHACVVVVPDLQAAAGELLRWKGSISSLGVGGCIKERAEEFFGLKFSRMCPIGMMQKPGLGWSHDGQRPLASLLRWRTAE